MTCYFLLRNNQESGPFTLDELKSHGLLTTDLIWVEGESRSWQHPEEIQALGIIPKVDVQSHTSANFSVTNNRPFAPSLQDYQQALNASDDFVNDVENNGPYFYRSKTVRRTNRQTNSFALSSRIFGALILLIGLVLCGFVVVSMLKQFDGAETVAMASKSEAVEIRSEVLPVSSTSHTAQANLIQPTSITPTATPSVLLDTAHAKTIVAKKTSKTATIAKQKQPLRDTTLQSSLAKNELPLTEDEAAQKPKEETGAVQAAVRAPSLELAANDYKVGLFGGVSNLELSVSNPSAQKIASAVIEIEFLKPNGNVVKTQTVTAENIAANSSKTVAVPSSSRGVKVRYHVLNVDVQN